MIAWIIQSAGKLIPHFRLNLKALDFRDACRHIGIKHIRTKPYTPKTSGKAEHFIQTTLKEWAYTQAHSTSDRRASKVLNLNNRLAASGAVPHEDSNELL